MSPDPIPFFRPEIGEAEIEGVADVLRSGWLTTGSVTGEFEARFAEYVGAGHAVAVNSCTAALHLALAAAGVGPGDEVILPTMTFAATAEVAVHLGARPVLVDSEPGGLNLDPGRVADAIGPRTRAVMPVHYAGQAAEMDPILELARDEDVVVVEDAAHSLPAAYRGRTVGSIGDYTCFSFYATKTLTTGEGGMVTTDDAEAAARIRSLSLHGLNRDAWDRYLGGPWDYRVVAAGYKYNLPDTASAIGLAQLDRCEAMAEARARAAAAYRERLAGVDGVRPLRVLPDRRHAWHLFVVEVGVEGRTADRDEVIRRLAGDGIGTSVHFRPLHLHPYYRDSLSADPADYPVATAAFDRILSLPLFPSITEDQIDRVAAALEASLG
jgi:perosamine synthetase